MKVLQDAWQCIYPNLCLGCNSVLVEQEEVLCLSCEASLDIIIGGANCKMIETIFWGRVKIDAAYSLLRFSQNSITQKMMHNLKYHGNQEAGKWFGRLLAKRLLNVLPDAVWTVVPVPIHPAKLKKRGFNQTDVIASGMVDMDIFEMNTNALVRASKGTSLTKLDRNERSELTASLYQLHPQQDLSGRNVLLLDDVLTTGATLTTCAQLLRKTQLSRLVVCTVAFSEK